MDAALTYIDDQGLAGLSMRRLGSILGVEAMALYRHVAGKAAAAPSVQQQAQHAKDQAAGSTQPTSTIGGATSAGAPAPRSTF